jgi:hypothetical protein
VIADVCGLKRHHSAQVLTRKYTSEAIKTLATIMRNAKAPPAARTAAASALLDRGYGRPAQAIEATLNHKTVQDMSDAELIAIAASSADDDMLDDEEPTTNTRRH